MNYLGYVVAAYLVFAGVMLLEWIVPQLQIRRILRMARRRAERHTARTSASPAAMELKR